MVRDVIFAGDVLDAEMALAYSVGEPEISHVHTLGAFPIELVVGETQGDCVVDAEQSRRLRIAEVRQRVAVLDCTLRGHECCAQFGLGHRSYHAVNHLAGIGDRAVDGESIAEVSEPSSN